MSGAAEGTRVGPTLQTRASLPVYVALQLRYGSGNALFRGGDVRIDVTGELAATPVGSASTHVTVAAGQHAAASVTLGPGPLPPGDDLSPTPTAPADLAMACIPGDLALLAADPHNCGACGHDCLGGACQGGLCQPMALATNQGNPEGIAVDASNVYFSRALAGGAIARLSLAGGAPAVIYSSSVQPLQLALVGSTLIVDEAAAHLKTLPVPDGAATLTAGIDAPITALAADSGHVYYAVSSDNVLRSLPLPLNAADTPAVVATLPAAATALATDGAKLYYGTTANSVGAVTLPSGTPTPLAAFYAQSLAVDGAALWIGTPGAGIVKASTTNGATLRTVPGTTASGLAVDAAAVYWGNPNDGTVQRLAK